MKLRYVLAVLAYILPTFPLGVVWHLVTFGEAYQRLDLYRTDMIFPLGVTSMLIQGVVFAWAYPRLFSTARDAWLRGAFGFAATFAPLALSFAVLPAAAKYQMTSVPDFLALETGFTVVHFAVISPLIALVYRGSTVASAEGPAMLPTR